MINTPKYLESYFQYVHSSLLNLQDEGGHFQSRNTVFVLKGPLEVSLSI